MNSYSSDDELTKTIIQTINERKPENVKHLIALVKENLSFTEGEILDAILKLQSQGAIKFDSQPLPASSKLTTYLKTTHALWYWATITIAMMTVAIVFLVPENFYPWSYLRNAIGTVFVLLLPGYALIKALFPVPVPIKAATETLDVIERTTLSFAMSIALVPLVGLLLNFTPWGIRLTPVVISLFALTLVFATVAVLKEHQIKNRL